MIFFPAAGLREREERAARKAAKKIEKARQTEAAKAQQTEAAAVQPQLAPHITVTQNSPFYSHLNSSSAPLFPTPDFTNTMHSPAAPVFQGSNLTLPPRNVGGWNQNQFVGPGSSPPSNGIEPWNQHHGNQNLTGTSKLKATNFFL